MSTPLLNFFFQDREVAIHVTVTEYTNSWMVSFTDCVNDMEYVVTNYRNRDMAMKRGEELRKECLDYLKEYLKGVSE